MNNKPTAKDGPPPLAEGDPGAGGSIAEPEPELDAKPEAEIDEQPPESPPQAAADRPTAAYTAQGPHKELPVNVEAEKALLGALFADNRAYERVSEFLRPEHFAILEHGVVYEAIQRFVEENKLANPVTLSGLFKGNDDLIALGGARYLAELAMSAVTIMNTGEYGRIIYDLYMKRELIAVGNAIVARAYDHDAHDTAQMQIEAAESDFTALVSEGVGDSMAPISSALKIALNEVEAASKDDGYAGLQTGVTDIDQKLGGMYGGDLMILAGASSMGKTAKALCIALHNVELYKKTNGADGAVVMFSSLEMTSPQLAKRVLSKNSGISTYDLRKGTVKNWGALISASKDANDLPFYIDGSPGATVQGIRQRARRLKRKQGLGLLVVDYLQLITPDRKYSGQRVNEVAEISRSLKNLALELDIPVIALSQLSREVDKRDDHRPRKSDLRESGSLEHDADTIMFMFRAEHYTAENKPARKVGEDKEKFFKRLADWTVQMEDEKGKAEAIIAKNRHGAAGVSVDIHFDALRMAFENLVSDY